MAGGGAAKVGLFGCGSEMSFFLYHKKIIMNLDSENYFGWFNITMLVLMLVIIFTCYVQIAFLLYFNKVRKRINYTQIMHRYEHFRFAMLAVFVLYLAMFVCYMIILGGRI